MLKKLSLLTAFFALTLGFAACSSDDDDDKGITIEGESNLKVNGKEWKASSAPVFEEDYFVFFGGGHVMRFDGDLSDVEVGEDVTPSYIVFTSDNAKYVCQDGEMIVTKVTKDYVEIKFDNLEASYSGRYSDMLSDMREDDLTDILKMTGTVRFFRFDSMD